MVSLSDAHSSVPVVDEQGEVEDLSRVDAGLFRPFSELPLPLQARLRGRPKVQTPKQAVKIRLDADILAALRASGEGWQTRLNESLRASLLLSGKIPDTTQQKR